MFRDPFPATPSDPDPSSIRADSRQPRAGRTDPYFASQRHAGQLTYRRRENLRLITPHHVSFQPRTIREADTLWEAGHQVRVISRRVDPQLAQADRELAGTRGWRLEHVDLQRDGPRRSAWLRAAVVSRIFKTLFRCGAKNIGIVSRAALRGFDELLLLALSEPADWFIAHTQLALPLASAAARHWNANLACDCEDLLADLGF